MFLQLLVSKISLLNLSKTSPKPLQNRDPKKFSFCIYIYIYSILQQSASLGSGQNTTAISSLHSPLKIAFAKQIQRPSPGRRFPSSADPPRRVGLNRAAKLGVDPSHSTLNRFVPKWAPGLRSGPEDLSISQGLGSHIKAARAAWGYTP